MPAGPVGGFVGRERELEELRGEIGRPGLRVAGGREAERGRVLLVVGRPGIGRTAVAVELARQVAAGYPGGRHFVRLTGDGGEPLPAEEVADALAPAAGKPALVVLDDVARGDQLAGLLPLAPGSLVVATAGGPLTGVPDVRPCTLGGLDTPAAVELVARAVGGTRVTNDPRGVETLVQELGGHPTALRLVAAWLAAQPRLSLSEAAARLKAVPGPGELTRAFRLVYDALPASAALLLRLLVLAPAGRIDAQVASALAGCSVPAAQSTLDDFVASALLEGGGPRPYRVPGCLEPLLRALLEQHEKPDDVRLARARMLERTVRLLRSCGATLAGEAPEDGLPPTLRFASPAAAADWLADRRPALLAAARAAVADGELDTLARRLIAALVRALVSVPEGPQAMAAERYALHGLVLGVAERRGLHREKAAALINLADLDAEAGRGDGALAKYRQALDAARAGDDTDAEGRILEALGGTYLDRQDLPRACDWFGRALALRQARGELVHQARLHARIGSVLTYQAQYGLALREWRASAGTYRRLGDLPSQARALTEAARVQEYAGHPEDALRTCRDALYWARQAGERRLEAAVLLRLADALDRLGDSSGAGLQRAAAQRLFKPGEFPAF
ncbi:tetratricopeptide repeat protein [Actinacidiphila rubida]|uniref:tetratricopeptide repeat protein n=1 Tax=Actinacidiphila rubida TaxID=310780 RepID=UPI002244F784|nr:tetratricopeptide repeat protein [Actinacidiphila rubida]